MAVRSPPAADRFFAHREARFVMAKMMLTLHDRPPDLDIETVIAELGLDAAEVDLEYGLQLIDPAAGDYVMLVEEAAVQRIDPAQAGVSGPYADVEIETFGPPESAED